MRPIKNGSFLLLFLTGICNRLFVESKMAQNECILWENCIVDMGPKINGVYGADEKVFVPRSLGGNFYSNKVHLLCKKQKRSSSISESIISI